MANQMPGITIEGDSELGELLKSLPGNLLAEVASGMNEIGKIVVKSAQVKLVRGHGYDTGALRSSIGIRAIKLYLKENRVVMYVGPRMKWKGVQKIGKKKHDPAKIAHLVEFGHRIAVGGKLTRTSRSGKVTAGQGVEAGEVPAKPFLRPAIDENKERFSRIMADRIRKLLSQRAKRLTKKAS